MLGSLITAPLRLGLRVTELTLHGTIEIVKRAAAAVGLAPDQAPPDEAEPSPAPEPYLATEASPATAPEASPATATEPAPEASPAIAPEPPPPPADAAAAPEPFAINDAPPIDYDAPAAPEPAHVSEEPVLVDESADAGAEDGAGAQIRVAEPWEGYRLLRAADVIDRLGGASVAELAAVEFYEQAGRQRRTVISAVQLELRRRG